MSPLGQWCGRRIGGEVADYVLIRQRHRQNQSRNQEVRRPWVSRFGLVPWIL